MEEPLKQAHKKVDEVRDLLAKATSLLEKDKAAYEKEKKEFNDSKQKIEKVNFSSQVTLDVGGEKFTTSLSTLQSDKECFFAKMFSGNWKLEATKDGAYFIDRDGTYFRHILNFLRRGEVVVKDDDVREELLIEAEFYQIQGLISLLKKGQVLDLFQTTTLLSNEQQKKLNEWFGNPTQKWKLLYKGSTHGFAAANFHSKCNNQGQTYSVIRSTGGFLFGGYTPIIWTSRSNYAADPRTFIFTLTNPNGIAPTKYTNSAGNSIYDDASYGPSFGSGQDICVSNQCNANTSSYTNFPHSFADSTGHENDTFTGGYNFQVSDIEVFTTL